MRCRVLEEETLPTKAVVAEANESRFKLQRQLSSLTKQAAGEKEFLEKKSAQLEKEKALALQSQGRTAAEIAAELKISRASVYRLISESQHKDLS